MRVLGFHIKEIRSIMLKDSFVTWILGTTLGIPLGIGFLNAYVSVADSKDAQFSHIFPHHTSRCRPCSCYATC